MTFRLNGRKYRISLRLAVVASIQREGVSDPAYREVAVRAAICNPVDPFDIQYGARLAVSRALKQAFPKASVRSLIWAQVLDKINNKAQEILDAAIAADADRFLRYVTRLKRGRKANGNQQSNVLSPVDLNSLRVEGPLRHTDAA